MDEKTQNLLDALEYYLKKIMDAGRDNKEVQANCIECISHISKYKISSPISGVILPKKQGEGEGRVMIDKRGIRDIPAEDAEVIDFPDKDR